MSADKHCRAKTTIVQALHQLRNDHTAVFVDGMRCYWPARPYTDNRDEAAALRIASAIAYAELGSPTELEPLIDLLVDPVSDVHLAAVRALVALGGPHGARVIRLKTVLGDDNPNVMEECFAGLLQAGRELRLASADRMRKYRTRPNAQATDAPRDLPRALVSRSGRPLKPWVSTANGELLSSFLSLL